MGCVWSFFPVAIFKLVATPTHIFMYAFVYNSIEIMQRVIIIYARRKREEEKGNKKAS